MTLPSSPVPAPEDTLTGWMAIPLEHTRSCQHWNDDGCTCALEIRIAARNWMELHNAWRKRAEEAEAELDQLRAVPTSEDRQLKSMLEDFHECDEGAPGYTEYFQRITAFVSRLRSQVERMEAKEAESQRRLEMADGLIAAMNRDMTALEDDLLTPEEARECLYFMDRGSEDNGSALIIKLRRRLSSGDTE